MEKRTFIITVLIILIFFLVGLITLCIMDTLIHDMIIKQSRLIPNSEIYEQWLKPSIPVYMQFYLFNLTNPTEFKAGQKPIVEQLGPYSYLEKRFKVNVTHNAIEGTVTYKEVTQYFFDPTMSKGLETDVITTTNLAYLTVANGTSWLPLTIDRIIEILEHELNEYLIVQHTVAEILWGYEDVILNWLKHLNFTIPTTKVGLFTEKNNTDGGVFQIDDGVLDPSVLGQIRQYHGQTSMSCWSTPTANMINGSDGTLFHPFLNLSERPYIFSSDICRSVQLYAHSKTIYNGIPVLNFLINEDTFKSALNVEKNRGFCLNWPNCYGDGVLDMSTCLPRAPIVISLPHFLYANKTYQDAVQGLHPTEEFNTTFHIEPQTGAILGLAKKYQINAIVKHNPKFKELRNLSSVFLPIAFVNETFQIDQKMSNQLRNLLIQGPIIAKVILSLFVIVLSIGIFVIIGTFIYQRRTEADYEPILPSTSDS